MGIEKIIEAFVLFQIGNWFSYFVIRTSLETSLASLFFTGFFALFLCLSIVFKRVL